MSIPQTPPTDELPEGFVPDEDGEVLPEGFVPDEEP